MRLRGIPVTVVGLGKSGFAAAKFLASRQARVRATDAGAKPEVLENAEYLRALGVDVETGGHTEAFVKGSALVVTSPGVPKTSVPLAAAMRFRIPVISEVELASRFCKGVVVGVTGSNGKTTTCHLLHKVFSETGRKSVLCGNVGFSFLDAVPGIGRGTRVTLELSSFQLEDCTAFRPRVAVVLNVSPNHLDRHKTLANYAAAKARILEHQRLSDDAVLNGDDPVVRKMAKKARARVTWFSRFPLEEGVFPKDGKVVYRRGGLEKTLFALDAVKLKGDHNLENLMAAAAAATLLGASSRAIARAFASFETLEHRIEPVRTLRGVRFVNDSKSTTVASTRAAVESVAEPVILLAGGRDKGAPFDEIGPLVRKKVKLAVLYGEAREKIARAWKGFGRVKLVPRFEDAVKVAYRSATAGDTVLLSPMCTSFDQFNSYEHRGREFKRVVAGL